VILVVVSVATTAGQSPGALTLPAAIAEALDHSPALQQPLDSVELTGIQARLAASAFGLKVTPSLSTANGPTGGAAQTAGVTVAKQLTTGAQVFMNVSSYTLGGPGERVRDAGYTVGFSQPLLRGFSQTATAGVVDARRAGVGADRDLAVARSALVVDVTRRFFDVIKQQRLAAAATKAADRATTLKTASEARTKAGLATELDVLRADVQASQMAAAVTATETALASARDQLATLIGRRLNADQIVLAEPDPAGASESLDGLPASVDDLVTLALSARVEVAEAHDRVRDASRASDVAKWNLLPPVSLDVSYTQRGLGSPSGAALNALVGGWRVGLSTSYSLDRSAETAAAAASRVSVNAAERSAHDAEQRIAAEVRQVHRQWQAAIASVAIQEHAVELAQREVRLAGLRLERGLSSTLDVVAAQNSLLQAENALIAAELDRMVFALDLRRAVGALDTKEFLP
jgi:outer membrane protein